MSLASLGLPREAAARRVVAALSGVTFLLWVGGSAIVPLLPTYLRAHAFSPALVGVVMASYFASSVITQYPLGRLSDRFGSRGVVAGGIVVFGIGSVGFALTTGAAGAITSRALQGAGAGAVTVAAASAIATAVGPGERGSGFGILYGAQMLALAVGPLVGGFVGASSMRILFLGAALLGALALVPVYGLLAPRAKAAALPRRHPARALLRSPALVGTASIFAAVGLQTGMYESCWSLLLQSHRATSLAIGLSWTLYCLPYALLSAPSGRLADRLDRRVLVVAGMFTSSLFAVIYPLLDSATWLVGLGCIEAVGAVVVTPAALSILAEWTPGGSQGAAQGVIGTARTSFTAAAAAGCGALFGVSHPLPFDTVGVLMLALAMLAAYRWRALPGRARDRSSSPRRVRGANNSLVSGAMLVVTGVVVEGDHRGRELGFPTANVLSDDELPPDGVYAGFVERADGSTFLSAISVGHRATFYGADGLRLTEAFLLDFDGDLYGERIRVTIAELIRGQRRFSGRAELVAQIRADVESVRELLELDQLTGSD